MLTIELDAPPKPAEAGKRSIEPGRPALSVVVPCYNEAEGLAELHRRVTEACRAAMGQDYELVLVDDGSSDGTWGLLRALAASDPAVVAVQLSRNYGHQLALSAGLRECRGDLVLVLDADLQDPPELLPDMLAMVGDGADVVYGRRIARDGETWFKKVSARAFYWLLNRLSDTPMAPDTGDFRLMRRHVVDLLNDMPERHRYIRGMISWVGFDQRPLLYHRAARKAGESHYPLGRMLRLALDAITGFSVRPLRLAVGAGAVSLALGLMLMMVTLVSWALGHVVAGWTSLMVVVLFLGGVQLLMLGVMGEYLGRLFVEAKQRPLYIVRQTLRHEREVLP